MWLVFVLLISLGVFCIWYFVTGFFHSLGEALIIAGILGCTVDYYIKKKLVQEAIRGIDKYLLGYALPSDLQDKLREIRDAKIVRRNFVCEYTILPIQGERKIKVEAHLTFEVENITNQPQNYVQELMLDKHLSPEIKLMYCETNDRSAQYRLEGSALTERIDQNTQANPSAAIIEVSADRVRLQSKSQYTFIYYKFHTNFSQIDPDVGSDYFQFDQPYPTINVRMIVNHPKGYTITFPSAPNKMEPTKSEWSADKVFLRGEVVTMWWRPENPQGFSS